VADWQRHRHGPDWRSAHGLAAALLFTFFVRQRIALGDDERANSRMAKAVAVVSVLLWSGVGIMGRGIGFY
jgi:hypothetical protein